MLAESEIEPVADLPDAADAAGARSRRGGVASSIARSSSGSTAGLGTSMGMTRAKSLLAGEGRPDLPRRHRPPGPRRCARRHGARLPLRAHEQLLHARGHAGGARAPTPTSWWTACRSTSSRAASRSCAPTISRPATWPADPGLEWCPPGPRRPVHLAAHLRRARRAAARRASAGRSCRTPTTSARCSTGGSSPGSPREEIPFVMEVADRTEADRKGGHLARRADGRLVLREIGADARGRPGRLPGHRAVTATSTRTTCGSTSTRSPRRWRERDGVLGLPMIVNRKTVDPRDGASPHVLQIETAMGAAISVFAGRARVRVPRSRLRAGQDDQRPPRPALRSLRADRRRADRRRARRRRPSCSSTSTPPTTAARRLRGTLPRRGRPRCVGLRAPRRSRRRDLRRRRRRARAGRARRADAGADRRRRRDRRLTATRPREPVASEPRPSERATPAPRAGARGTRARRGWRPARPRAGRPPRPPRRGPGGAAGRRGRRGRGGSRRARRRARRSSASPAAGPSAIATATARLSSTTGVARDRGEQRRRARRSAPSRCRRRRRARVLGRDRRLERVRRRARRGAARAASARAPPRSRSRSQRARSWSSSSTSAPPASARASRRESCSSISASRPSASGSSGMQRARARRASRIASAHRSRAHERVAGGRGVALVEDQVERRRAPSAAARAARASAGTS